VTFWATFSQTHLVTLLSVEQFSGGKKTFKYEELLQKLSALFQLQKVRNGK
jgi:hypothetical protein